MGSTKEEKGIFSNKAAAQSGQPLPEADCFFPRSCGEAGKLPMENK